MMTKIINAKSQIGKTEKTESEMMLLNFDDVIDTTITVRRSDGKFVAIIKDKILMCVRSNFATSGDLRQIADKLDELNGVELPEFLKEQA